MLINQNVQVTTNEVDLCEQAVSLKGNIENAFMILGQILGNIKELEAWKGRCTSFREFVETDMGFSVDNADKMIAVSNYIGKNRHVAANTGYSKVYRAMKLYPDRPVEEVLEIAAASTARELENDARMARAGEHACLPGEERWGKCEKCGKFIKIS